MSQTDQDNAITADSNNEPQENSPPCLKLIADCWNHIFDFLSVRDVERMGKTCKQMYQIAGQYVLENSKECYFHFYKMDFCEYISNMVISQGCRLNNFIGIDTYPFLKTIIINGMTLRNTEIQYMRNVLKNIENMHLNSCDIGYRALKQLIPYCPKLKYLKVESHYKTETTTKAMFLQLCPALENLQYQASPPFDYTQNVNLKPFLEKNTTLKHFGCLDTFLWANRDLLIKTNVQLDSLTIYFENLFQSTWGFTLCDQFKDFLQVLHERGFYKALHISRKTCIKDTTFENVSRLIDTVPALEMLNISRSSVYKNSSRLISLKELCLENCGLDDELIAKNLISLERLTLKDDEEIDCIVPFIRHSKKLKIIKADFICYYISDSIDIFTLNEERKMLSNACRVVIYVNEEVYLDLKWKFNNLSLSHIKFTRSGQY